MMLLPFQYICILLYYQGVAGDRNERGWLLLVELVLPAAAAVLQCWPEY